MNRSGFVRRFGDGLTVATWDRRASEKLSGGRAKVAR